MDPQKAFQHFSHAYFKQKVNDMVCEYFSNKNLFKRSMLPQRQQTFNIFGPLALTIKELHLSLRY